MIIFFFSHVFKSFVALSRSNTRLCEIKKKPSFQHFVEIITVTQHTQTTRYKRDVSPEGVLLAKDFPRYMEFTLHLQDGDLRLILQKYMTPHDVISNDKNGAVTFDSEDIRVSNVFLALSCWVLIVEDYTNTFLLVK